MQHDGHSLPIVSAPEAQIADNCWSSIGIRGDRSCPELLKVIHCNNCPVFASAAQTLLNRAAPSGYLDELADFVAEPAVAAAQADQAVVLFDVGNEHYAIGSGEVLEVAETAPPRSVPHRSNETFVGLVTIRGQLELCMSLAGLLGLPTSKSPPAATTRVLVVAVRGQRWVLLVDNVHGVQRFHESELLDVPPTSRRRANEYVTALIAHGKEHFGLLDLTRICASLQEKLG